MTIKKPQGHERDLAILFKKPTKTQQRPTVYWSDAVVTKYCHAFVRSPTTMPLMIVQAFFFANHKSSRRRRTGAVISSEQFSQCFHVK